MRIQEVVPRCSVFGIIQHGRLVGELYFTQFLQIACGWKTSGLIWEMSLRGVAHTFTTRIFTTNRTALLADRAFAAARIEALERLSAYSLKAKEVFLFLSAFNLLSLLCWSVNGLDWEVLRLEVSWSEYDWESSPSGHLVSILVPGSQQCEKKDFH